MSGKTLGIEMTTRTEKEIERLLRDVSELRAEWIRQLTVVSNGRIFYASQASGLVVSQTYGADSKKLPAVWERP